jgi:hypothetical protein
MLQLLLLHPVIRMMQQMQRKAQRRGGMPLPPARQAEVFGRVGKPLPTSLEDGTPVEQIADILGHQSVQSTGVYLKPRVLHQAGEKPQVTRSKRYRNGLTGLSAAAV